MSEPSPHLSTDGYSAAIVTFRREGELARVLDGLVAQAAAPGLVVVADNDPDRSAEDVVASFAADADVEVVYLPVGRNLGPAGGWAAAAALAASHPARGKWFAVFDDDDPIAHPDVMLRLIRRATAAPPEVAAVGLRGATLRRWSATLRRAPELPGSPARADYLASGGAPLYRWSAIEDVGFFDPDLFFGFEDLDLGLRLRARGLSLLVEPGSDIHEVASTSTARVPWREYYKTRALVVICRRHLGLPALAATIARTIALGGPALLLKGEPSLLRARFRGVRDGIAGRLGPGAHAPDSNPPKP